MKKQIDNIENKVDDKQTEEKKIEENVDIPKDETKEILEKSPEQEKNLNLKK